MQKTNIFQKCLLTSHSNVCLKIKCQGKFAILVLITTPKKVVQQQNIFRVISSFIVEKLFWFGKSSKQQYGSIK